MDYFRADVKVGAFIFVSLILLVFAAIVVGGAGTWFSAKQRYTVLLPNANLLRNRAQVSYAGHPVGEVTAIEVRPKELRAQHHPAYPVAVTIMVRSSVSLCTDSRVEMKTDGFIGDRYLDISPGCDDSQAEPQLIPSNGTILGAIGGIEGMMASLSGIGGGLGDMSEALRSLLMDASQPHSLPGTLVSVRRLVDTLLPRITTLTAAVNDLLQHIKRDVTVASNKAGRTLATIDSAIAENRSGFQQLIRELITTLLEVQQTVGTMNQFVETRQEDITELIGSLRAVSESLQRNTEETTNRLQQLLTHADKAVLQNDRNIYVTIENLRDMTDNLKATSQLLRANPAVILWGNRNSGTNPGHTTRDGNEILQDRGRIGRYDRVR